MGTGSMLAMFITTWLVGAAAESRRQCFSHGRHNAASAAFFARSASRNNCRRHNHVFCRSRFSSSPLSATSTLTRRDDRERHSRKTSSSSACDDGGRRPPPDFSPTITNRIRDLTSHPAVVWDESSTFASMHKKKLRRRHLPLFDRSDADDDSFDGDIAVGTFDDSKTTRDHLFDRFARAVCCAGVVARKEIFETWAAALYVHSSFLSDNGESDSAGDEERVIRRVADIAAGHGLLAWALLILDDEHRRSRADGDCGASSSSLRPLTVLCLDKTMPRSAEKIYSSMVREWPRLEERFDYVEGRLEQLVPHPSCLLASVHACGILSDVLVATAAEHAVPLSLVPCCHSRKPKVLEVASPFAADIYEDIILNGGALPDLADRLDEARMTALENSGMDVREAFLPSAFTGKCRLIAGFPDEEGPRRLDADRLEPRRPAMTTVRKGRMPPLESEPAGAILPKSRFLRGFSVPCEDVPERRRQVSEISGRAAADARKEVMHNRKHERAPRMDLSLWLPPAPGEDDVVLSEKSLSRIVESNHVGGGVRCSVSKVGDVYVDPSGRRAQTFRIEYEDVSDREGVMSFDDAKAMHERLYGMVPKVFPGAECR